MHLAGVTLQHPSRQWTTMCLVVAGGKGKEKR